MLLRGEGSWRSFFGAELRGEVLVDVNQIVFYLASHVNEVLLQKSTILKLHVLLLLLLPFIK